MSIASRITSIEGHIGDIYDSVELTGVDTTDIDKNLVNVPNTLKEGYIDIINNGTDTLYNNFPKVSGEGTSLTLNNTYQAPMRNNLKGNTSQTGTPTPTSPIPVNVVSGDNEIFVNGKNLFDKTRLISGKRLDNTGLPSITDNAYCTTDYFVKVEPNTTYYSTSAINQSKAVCFYDSGQTFIERKMYLNAHTFTAGATAQFIKISILLSEIDTEQLEKGSSATTYEAYTGNTYNVDLPVENLLDNTLLPTSWNNTSVTTITLNVKPNTKYTMSCNVPFKDTYANIFFYDESGTGSTSSNGVTSGKSVTVTSSSNGIVKVGYRSYGSSTLNRDDYWYMVVEGEKVNSYTPYGTTPIELCKIGNYQDYFAKSDGSNLFNYNLFETFTTTIQYVSINLKPNTKYTMSSNIPITSGVGTNLFFMKDGETASTSTNGVRPDTPVTLTTDSTGVVKVGYRTGTGVSANPKTDYWYMINEGSTALPYQPYGVGKWYLHKEIGKVTYNGTENWTTFAINYEYQIILQDAKEGDYENQFFPSLCNKYLNHNVGGASLNNYEFSNFTSGVYRWIRIRHNDITTLANYKTWLASNTPTFYYLLATPTNTEITDTTLINQLEELYIAKSKENQTNISQINNDLPFIISASALKKG